MTAKIYPICNSHACFLFIKGCESAFYACAETAYDAFSKAIAIARASGAVK